PNASLHKPLTKRNPPTLTRPTARGTSASPSSRLSTSSTHRPSPQLVVQQPTGGLRSSTRGSPSSSLLS
ncbi:hypothetical protein C0993_003908, partial [Termitomyces sp. T159_Od127]